MRKKKHKKNNKNNTQKKKKKKKKKIKMAIWTSEGRGFGRQLLKTL